MIKIAAIKFEKEEKMIIVTGERHSDCYEILFNTYRVPFGSKDYNIEEGFLTANDIFVNRYDAYHIALENKQIISNTIGPALYSEDIY